MDTATETFTQTTLLLMTTTVSISCWNNFLIWGMLCLIKCKIGIFIDCHQSGDFESLLSEVGNDSWNRGCSLLFLWNHFIFIIISVFFFIWSTYMHTCLRLVIEYLQGKETQQLLGSLSLWQISNFVQLSLETWVIVSDHQQQMRESSVRSSQARSVSFSRYSAKTNITIWFNQTINQSCHRIWKLVKRPKLPLIALKWMHNWRLWDEIFLQ